jgi:hypothetical protein
VFDYYRDNAGAVQSARAPVYEDKVVDLILAAAKVTEKAVSGDQLAKAYEAMEAEDATEAEDKVEKKPAQQATATRLRRSEASASPRREKSSAKKAAAAKTPAKKTVAKKTAAKAKSKKK